MKDVLLDIIGEYVPFDTLEQNAMIDWPWIFSAILFVSLIIVTAWFACRIIVGVLKND